MSKVTQQESMSLLPRAISFLQSWGIGQQDKLGLEPSGVAGLARPTHSQWALAPDLTTAVRCSLGSSFPRLASTGNSHFPMVPPPWLS